MPMAPTVVLFPGQGSQKQGMAQDFHRDFPLAGEVFEEASQALDLDMKSLCFEEDPRLHLTAFTQPAILTAEIAMYRVLVQEFGLDAQVFGGHSLGEYAALVAAETIPLAQALGLVRLRGQLMQQAVPEGQGAMAALIRSDLDPVAIGAVLEGLQVDLANLNSPNQIVISGATDDVESGIERLLSDPAAQGAKARMLKVSAPFHSRMMATIEPEFRSALLESLPSWKPEASTHVLSNTSGGFHDGSAEGLVDRLTRQISGEVRWVQNMRAVVELEPRRVLEIGPGRPLRGFFRGINYTVESITNLVSARRAMLVPH
jgi:malonyl CoA-acyl carrier protein transacylase